MYLMLCYGRSGKIMLKSCKDSLSYSEKMRFGSTYEFLETNLLQSTLANTSQELHNSKTKQNAELHRNNWKIASKFAFSR